MKASNVVVVLRVAATDATAAAIVQNIYQQVAYVVEIDFLAVLEPIFQLRMVIAFYASSGVHVV